MSPIVELALIALGGGLGALARDVLRTRSGEGWRGVLIANLVGALGIGLVAAAPPAWRSFAAIGLCGALTTFSSFSLENARAFAANQRSRLLIMVGVTLVVGLAATWAGLWLTTVR